MSDQRDGLSPSYFNTSFGTFLNTDILELNYPQRCFDYFHQNPVAAGFVNKQEDWAYSSASCYAENSENTIVNKSLATKEGLECR